MQTFAGDVVPVAAGFVVVEEDEAVVESACAQVEEFAVDGWSQTDSGMADGSKGDDVGLLGQLALGDVVVGHLRGVERHALATAFEDQKEVVAGQLGLGERLPVATHGEATKHVGALEMGFAELKRHSVLRVAWTRRWMMPRRPAKVQRPVCSCSSPPTVVAVTRIAMSRRSLSSFPPAYFAGHLALMLALHFGVPLAQWNGGVSRWAGLPLVVVGCSMLAWSVRRFLPVTTLRPFETSSVLVTNGLYRVTRNPMYLSLLLSLVGAAVMLGSLSSLLVVPLFVVVMQRRFIEREEADLGVRFGATYGEYCARVRRWI